MTTALLIINFGVSLATCLRLLSFRRAHYRYKRIGAWLAYALIVTTGSIAIMIAIGAYGQTPVVAEIVVNSVLCGSVWLAKGNVMSIVRAMQKKYEYRPRIVVFTRSTDP